MPANHFKSTLLKIGPYDLIHLPQVASAGLPSRGMVMVEGTMNGVSFQAPLEPDGRGSHWFKLDEAQRQAIQAKIGDTIEIKLEPSKTWPEPEVPADWQNALDSSPEVSTRWHAVTPMARWDWLRWIGSTAQPATRQRHIEVACSKLLAGERRPCCFNRSMCTDPTVAKSGILLDTTA